MEHERTSEVLQRIVARAQEYPLSLRECADMLGARAFAVAIFVFALMNLVPMPGLTAITGLPPLLLSCQLALGRERLWLPRRFEHRRISPSRLEQLFARVMPKLTLLERYLYPRGRWVEWRTSQRLLGLLMALLSLIIVLPIPLANFLPALSLALIALGLLERDGLFTACAVGFTLMALSLVSAVIVASVAKVMEMFW